MFENIFNILALGKNVDYDEIPLNQVRNRVIEEIKDDVAVWLQENLIKRFNSLYNEVFVPRGNLAKMHSEPCQTSNMECFAKIVNS